MKSTIFIVSVILIFISCSGSCALAADAAQSEMLTALERKSLLEEVAPAYDKADRGSRWWSVAFHSCLFLGAAASAAAALILKLDRLKDWPPRTDLAASLAALAAFLPLISTSGNFSQKWATNRATRAALADLILEVRLTAGTSTPTASMFARRYKDIMAQHELGIVPRSESVDAKRTSKSN